jgi:hypothetical protein
VVSSFTLTELTNDPTRRAAVQLLFELLDVGGVADQADDGVAPVEQQAGDMGADEAGRAGEQDVHGQWGGGCRQGAQADGGDCCRCRPALARAGRTFRGRRHAVAGPVMAAQVRAGRILVLAAGLDWSRRA